MPKTVEMRSVLSGVTIPVVDDGYNANNQHKPAGGRQHILRLLKMTAVVDGFGEVPVWYPVAPFDSFVVGRSQMVPSPEMRQRTVWGEQQEKILAVARVAAEKRLAAAQSGADQRIAAALKDVESSAKRVSAESDAVAAKLAELDAKSAALDEKLAALDEKLAGKSARGGGR